MNRKILLSLAAFFVLTFHASADPGERFLSAYFLVQEGDAAERQSDWTRANAKYAGALDILREIKTESPEWNPHIIDFRLKYCADHLAMLKPKLPTAPAPVVQQPPPAPPVAPPQQAATAPAPAEDRVAQLTAQLNQAQDQIRQLETQRDQLNAKVQEALRRPVATETATAQLERAQDQIRQLESARDALKKQLDDAQRKALDYDKAQARIAELEASRADLNAKLQEALSKLAPTQTTPQVEELLKQNRDLAAQLAAAQTQITELRQRTVAVAPAAESEELTRLRSELAQTKQQLDSTQRELETTKAESTKLRLSYDQLAAQLAQANRALDAAKISSSKDEEIMAQLRKENELLQQLVERKVPLTSGTAEDSGIPELRGVRRRQPAAAAGTNAPSRTTSAPGKMVATIKAPMPPPPQQTPKPAPAAQPTPPTAPVTPPPAAVTTTASARARAAEPPPPVASSPPVRELLNDARTAFALKDLETAAAKYDAALAIEPNNIVALSNLGVIRYQQGRIDDAEQVLRKATAVAPNDSPSRSLLGVIYFRKGMLDEAFSELTRAVALNPRNAEAHNYLGITLSEKSWTAAAEQEIRRAIELNPQYADAHFNLAVLYAKQKTPKIELARYHYRKALDLGAEPDPQIEAILKAAADKDAKAKDGPAEN